MNPTAIIYTALLLVGITLLVMYSRSGKLLRSIVFTTVSGLLALTVVLLAANFLHLPIALTPLSVLTSSILGVPGVFAMLVLCLI